MVVRMNRCGHVDGLVGWPHQQVVMQAGRRGNRCHVPGACGSAGRRSMNRWMTCRHKNGCMMVGRGNAGSCVGSQHEMIGGRQRERVMMCASSGDDMPEENEEDGEGEGEDEYATYVFGEDDLMPDDDEDPTMRLYLDSANYEEWKKWAETGMFYGFTTNPTILKKGGIHCTLPSIRQLTRLAFDLDVEELQLQAWGETVAEMYSCALDLAELDTRVVVKVPMTMDGILTARRLVNDGVPVTFTAVYSVHQVVTALSVGASYVAPYLGRMHDAGKDAMTEVSEMQDIIDMSTSCSGDVRLLVASIRSADEIAHLASQGCNTFTISSKVAEELVSDPLTVAAAELFEEHAKEMGSIGS